MQTVKPSLGDQIPRRAAEMLRKANADLAIAKKQADCAKVTISQWLETERGIKVSDLLVGEMVNIEGCCLIEIGKQQRLDQNGLQMENPEVFSQFYKEFPTTKYKSLV